MSIPSSTASYGGVQYAMPLGTPPVYAPPTQTSSAGAGASSGPRPSTTQVVIGSHVDAAKAAALRAKTIAKAETAASSFKDNAFNVLWQVMGFGVACEVISQWMQKQKRSANEVIRKEENDKYHRDGPHAPRVIPTPELVNECKAALDDAKSKGEEQKTLIEHMHLEGHASSAGVIQYYRIDQARSAWALAACRCNLPSKFADSQLGLDAPQIAEAKALVEAKADPTPQQVAAWRKNAIYAADDSLVYRRTTNHATLPKGQPIGFVRHEPWEHLVLHHLFGCGTFPHV